jgi:hypothetical protein
MTPQELAAQLTGIEYPPRLKTETTVAAKADGLVVVFGGSDDLVEFRGAIYDEIGAYGGTTFTIDAEGPIPDFDSLEKNDREAKDRLREYFRREGRGKEIEAVWDQDGYSWTYKTDIPHATFEVVEDGEKYCRGIVFALADLA